MSEDSDNMYGSDAESVENSVTSGDNIEEENDNISVSDLDSLSGDDNADGQDWMDVDEDSNSSNSDSDSEEDPQERRIDMDNGDPKLHGNAGWADVMAKILRTSKPKGKKSIVLAKAKKLSQISTAEPSEQTDKDYGFEIDGQADVEDVKPSTDELDVKPTPSAVRVKMSRRDHLADARVKPSILDRERERALSKIATKGVVQLFNAVREQQKDISHKIKKANGSVRKEEKVLKSIDKRAFLDVLMGNAKSEKVQDNVRIKKQEDLKSEKVDEADKPATWSVLRDNFLTGSNLKNWDKCGEIKLEDDIEEVELN